MSQSLENRQKLMKSEQIKTWVDVLKSDKDRKHHEEVLLKCVFAPFLFGKSYLGDKWISWGVDTKLFRDLGQPKEILDKLEGLYFDILDTVSAANTLVCKKLKETKAVDITSILILSEKCNKCIHWREVLKAAEINDFFSKLKKQLEATTSERGDKIGMTLLLAIQQYAEYVVQSVVRKRNFQEEMDKLGTDDMKNFFRTKGNESFKVGLFNDALKHYTDAINADRFNYILYSNRAQTNLNLRKFQEALCDARRAVILKPDWPKGHYRYAQAFYELGKIDKAKEVNRNGLEICRQALPAITSGNNNPISYLEIQAAKFSEKENEEDEVPELVDASSSNSDSADSEEEEEPKFNKDKKEATKDQPPKEGFSAERQEIDVGVLQKILKHKQEEDEKARLKKEKKRERKVELKRQAAAEEEEKKKKEEAGRKKYKEEKDKRKEDDKIRKAEKKRREEEKLLAEKARQEKLAATRELENTMKQGSEALLDTRGRQAVTFYQKAQELVHQSSEQWGGLSEEDYVTFLYAWGMAGLESAIAKEVNDAVQRFDAMLSNHSHIHSPLAYYGLAFAYFKHCKFHEAFEPLDKCEQMARKLNYVVETWPGTTKSIKETTKGQMEVAVSNLRDRCKNPPTADATCRHGDCPSSREIYLTDPEFKGYVSTSCTEHCMTDYHVSCWKKAKSDWEGLVHDKDVINRKCNTPDCLGEIITLTIYGSDGFPRVEAKSEKVKKEKEKAKAKGKSKSKQEKKKQKKQDAKKNLEKGQGDNGDRLESVSSSQGDRVAEELMMHRRVERGDDDTISTTSSNDIRRHDGETATVWSASLDDEDSQPRGFSDIEDILDDDLPISIPDATYVLKRDDFGDNEAAAKKSKPSKTKSKKKKAKAAADLNIQLQFTDDGQRSLMTSEDVMSPEAKARSAPYTTGTQENPFAMPQHLKEQATDFERSLPPVTFSQTIKGGQSFADMTKAVTAAETDEEKSQKIALLFHLSDLFEKLGPVLYSDPRLEMELDKLPEAPPVISRYGGLRKFLLQSSDFYVLEDHVSLAKDATKCQEMFTERNNKLKEAGLPPPPLSGIGVSALPQNVPPFPPIGGNHVTSTPGHFANMASDTVTPKPSSIGGLDALDSFDIPPSSGMDDIDDVSLQSDIKKGKMAVVVEQGSDSMWPKNQDIDQELDRVLASQQLDNAASLQSLKQGQPFSTTNGPGPYGLGVKSVSVDISSLPTYDSGLGSMQPNITSDNKKTLPNGNGTIHNSASITSAGISGKEKPAKGDFGGITSSVDLQSKTTTVSTVTGSKNVPKTDALSSLNQKVVVRDVADGVVVVRDVADGVDTNESVDKLSCDVVDKDDKDKTENKPPIIEVDIRDTGKSDPKLDVVNHLEENIKQQATDVSVVEYQKLMARYKIVHNACKNFQEKRKNMKSMLSQTVVVCLRTSGMNTEPFMEFEELKVIKERLQGSMRDTMQKYYQLQTSTNTQLDTMKATVEKKDAKEKELTNALTELRRLYETESNKWKQEKARAVEDLKGRDLKIRELEAEKFIFQNHLTTKDHELKGLQSKFQIDRDLWLGAKLKLEDAIQMSERNHKLQLKRAVDGEITVLQVRCKMDTRALETWLREAEFHLNNFKINLQRTPDNMKMKEGFSQWQNAVTENKQKLDLLKSQYEEQIGEIHGGRQLSQLATIEVPQLTKPGLPPLPPPGAFMGPRPGFIPPGGAPGVRPPLDASRPPLTPNPSPSPSSTSSPVHTQASKPQQGPISVSVPVDEASSAPLESKDGKGSVGPAKVTPAQVTVPLQEQAPWPPAASATPPQASPPGFPASKTAPSSIASNASTASGLGAVGSSRPQSVSGANATPGNNRPVKQAPAAASGQIPSAVLLSANLTQQPRTNFERILFPLQTLFPQHNQVQLTKAIKEVRQANSGSLSGLSVDEIIRRSASVLKHQPPMRQTGSASGGSAAASKGGWQNNNNQQVPQGQRLVTGVMQGMAAQQGKFQWSSELGGSSAFGKGLLDDEEDPCVICHEEMTPESIKVLDCGHRFHAECIKQWLNEQSTCPNCRNYTLLPDEYPSLH